MTETKKIHTLELTSDELTIVNSVLRQHKVNISAEDLTLFAMGKKTDPIIPLIIKVATMFETEVLQKNEPEATHEAATEVAES